MVTRGYAIVSPDVVSLSHKRASQGSEEKSLACSTKKAALVIPASERRQP